MLGRYLEAAGGDHEVLVLSNGECPDYFRSLGVPVTELGTLDAASGATRSLGAGAALRGAATTATGLPSVAGAIRRSSQRVVITNSMKAHVLVPPIARALRRRTGIRLHDVIDADTTSATARRLLATSARLAVSTACVSGATAAAARAAGLPRVTSFPNGVDVDGPGPGPAPQPPLRLLAVSQLARWKGVHLVLEAAATAAGQGVDLELDVLGAPLFGDEDYARELRELSARLGIAERVRWHGHADPAPLMRDAHLFVHLPVSPDPLPTVLLEALGHGLPVVASATGGIPEIVDDGTSGALVPTGDAAAAAAALVRLAEPAAREPLREGALAAARARFSVDAYVRNFDRWIAALSEPGAVAA